MYTAFLILLYLSFGTGVVKVTSIVDSTFPINEKTFAGFAVLIWPLIAALGLIYYSLKFFGCLLTMDFDDFFTVND